ncbi:MAG: hypothetical protein J6L69_07530 [Lachnospiraceae bacterium]|nr:hypothetical protein [Lachnospiraceae bacterium]
MKKKLLTVALAAVMVVSSALSVFGETATSLDNSAGWAKPSNAGDEELTGDFDVTYKFTIDAVGASNWLNYVIEFRTGDSADYDFLSIRADAFAFTNGPTFGKTFPAAGETANSKLVATWTGACADDAEWAEWLEDCVGSDVEINLVRTGDAFKYSAKFEDGHEFKADFSFGTVDVPDKIELTMFGDQAKFSNISFTNNTSSNDDSNTNNDANNNAGDNADNDSNADSNAGSNAGATTPDTGDSTMVGLLLAVAAVSVVVVLKRRTVAE